MKRNINLEKEIEELWNGGHAEALKYLGYLCYYNYMRSAAEAMVISGSLYILYRLIRKKLH